MRPSTLVISLSICFLNSVSCSWILLIRVSFYIAIETERLVLFLSVFFLPVWREWNPEFTEMVSARLLVSAPPSSRRFTGPRLRLLCF